MPNTAQKFLHAIFNQDYALAQRIISDDELDEEVDNEDVLTEPFMYVPAGDTEPVMLVPAGENVFATAILWATELKAKTLVNLLLEYDAPIDEPAVPINMPKKVLFEDKCTPFQAAIVNDAVDIARIFKAGEYLNEEGELEFFDPIEPCTQDLTLAAAFAGFEMISLIRSDLIENLSYEELAKLNREILTTVLKREKVVTEFKSFVDDSDDERKGKPQLVSNVDIALAQRIVTEWIPADQAQIPDQNGRTIMFDAVRASGDFVGFLIKNRGLSAIEHNGERISLIDHAASLRRLAAMSTLVDNGASVIGIPKAYFEDDRFAPFRFFDFDVDSEVDTVGSILQCFALNRETLSLRRVLSLKPHIFHPEIMKSQIHEILPYMSKHSQQFSNVFKVLESAGIFAPSASFASTQEPRVGTRLVDRRPRVEFVQGLSVETRLSAIRTGEESSSPSPQLPRKKDSKPRLHWKWRCFGAPGDAVPPSPIVLSTGSATPTSPSTPATATSNVVDAQQQKPSGSPFQLTLSG